MELANYIRHYSLMIIFRGIFFLTIFSNLHVCFIQVTFHMRLRLSLNYTLAFQLVTPL